MRYDVQQQVNDIDKALFILGLRKIPNMEQPTEVEFEDALKKAESCMKLIIHEMIRQDKTMKEIYCEKEALKEQSAMEVLDDLKNGPDIPKKPFSFPNNEVMVAAMKLQSCFKGSTFLIDREPIEFLADEKSNTYFILGNCETKEDVDCKVLEWLSRAAYKTDPYKSKVANENFHKSILSGINAYLGTNFTKEDIEIIYTYLGNACNHKKTLEFVRSEFDMDTFLEKSEEMER